MNRQNFDNLKILEDMPQFSWVYLCNENYVTVPVLKIGDYYHVNTKEIIGYSDSIFDVVEAINTIE